MSAVDLATFQQGLMLALAAIKAPFAADDLRIHGAFLAAAREFPDLAREPRADPVFGTVPEAFELLLVGLEDRIVEFPTLPPQRVRYLVGSAQARRELEKTGLASRFELAAEAFRRCVGAR